MRRIMVIGSPGAGKTTFALRFAEKLPLPVIHLDVHYWRSGWQPSDLDDWRERLAALAAAPEWIMDGNFYNTFELRMPRADTLAWLDYPRTKCLRRVLLRSLKDYRRSRPDLAEGCPEQFDAEFYRFVWDFPVKYRPYIVDGIERYGGHLRVSRFGHDRDAEHFLAMLGVP